MISSLVRWLRLYFIQAWFSYRALFAWSTPFNYLASKLGFPFFSMLLFIYLGKYVGLNDPVYIVIGNILLLPSLNGVMGISMTVGGEKQFGALSYLLGSPAPRGAVFLGRAFFHMVDGAITVLIALPIALLVFQLDLSQTNVGFLALCVILISITATGLGYIMGVVTLLSRDGWMITSTLSLAFYVLIGVNFPIDLLPPALKSISLALPMTRGIQAARLALGGAPFSELSSLIGGEVLVGLIYIIFGYALFRVVERLSFKSGMLDNF
jgi:ABC-2 type transport system permease protein